MKNVHITETVLRDAQQSLIATRMTREEFLPILKTMDEAGYYSLECWGGATFDSCLRYLDEDPWERLRTIKENVKNTKLQMLLRGQNILGYHHYSDETVREFVRLSIKNGIDIIRIFDALNDFTNIRVAVDECVKCGGHAQGTICYTTSPIHTVEKFALMGKELEDMGCNSICIKDMAGIMTPYQAYTLVSALKKSVSIPIFVHTHSTTALGPMTYEKAIEAGADGIDTAISVFSGGTAQPSTEAMHYSLREFNMETGLNTKKLKLINDHFTEVRKKYLENKVLNPRVLGVNIDALNYQIPGGMLSNLIAQLADQGKIEMLDEVLEETPIVRKDLGYPPLVTPMSQMVGVQAVMNVLFGGRYKNISKEVKAYLRGEYGLAPGEINESLKRDALEGVEEIKGRYADTLEGELETSKKALDNIGEGYSQIMENVLSHALFPSIAEKYFSKIEKEKERTMNFSYTIERVD